MIALSKWFGKKHERESGHGLFVTLEELVGMRRYAVYLRGLRRRKTFSRQAGEVKSAFKGRGMELEEIRGYTFGDDVRDIDWRVTARKDIPYTKLYAEEKDREIYIWLDLSAQMLFGTRKELKSVTAAKLAALLGWESLENKDRFGCVVFDGINSWLFKPQNNRAQLMAVFKKITEISEAVIRQPQGSGDDGPAAAKSLKLLEQSAKNQATVFLISDFSLGSESLRRQLAALSKKTRLYLINVFDVLEELPPKAGEYMAEYDGKRLIFDSAAKVYRNDYRNYFAKKRSVLQDFCRKFGCQLIEFRTDMEIANNFKIF